MLALEAGELVYQRIDVEKLTRQRHNHAVEGNCAANLPEHQNDERSAKQLVLLGHGVYPMSNHRIQSQ